MNSAKKNMKNRDILMISLPTQTLTRINKASNNLGISRGDYCELVIENWLSIQNLTNEFDELILMSKEIQDIMKNDITLLNKQLRSVKSTINKINKKRELIRKSGKKNLNRAVKDGIV